MDEKTLVEALRLCVDKENRFESRVTGQADCPFGETCIDCGQRMKTAAADRIEALTARLAEKDKQLAAAAERKQELDEALRDMVCQYCSFSGKLDHEFMSAGENAFCVLNLEHGAPTETLWRGPQEAGEVHQHGD